MIDNWADISDLQIKDVIMKIIHDYDGAYRKSLASNILQYYFPREFPFPGNSKEERKSNQAYVERFRQACVEPIVQSLLTDGVIIDDDGILYICEHNKVTY